MFNPGEFLETMLQIGKWFGLVVFVLTFAAHLLMGEINTWLSYVLPIVVACSFLIVLIGFLVPPLAKDEMIKRECRAVGGEWALLGGPENRYGCRKEYQSCGPDESRPGYTICEQKFKRVYPQNP